MPKTVDQEKSLMVTHVRNVLYTPEPNSKIGIVQLTVVTMVVKLLKLTELVKLALLARNQTQVIKIVFLIIKLANAHATNIIMEEFAITALSDKLLLTIFALNLLLASVTDHSKIHRTVMLVLLVLQAR